MQSEKIKTVGNGV